ncbi:MAG: TSUP family transporter [Lachnospiraceae bacterium]|nr:TSUP family transporter [Lachnospiraceae bacterium]
MEYFWYILAAIGAGVGTGLAGLSAATVMVPILIVLCPSFSGEYGPYQATAIALASDILGSAVTSATYAKNKKIDLKHGWIMLVCIVSMSTLGSYVAYLAGNQVLGGFTLFLTFCIGIRFLVKPDTSKSDAENTNVRLGAKEIAISLFFGLTIGFGTGFVGTGGGMMMLVVFTAFLGYELKTAVGTSTFIMTFTALIAFVSHTLIHPAIVLERWNVLILCIVVATLSSKFSAQFANRVSNRTVGLVTGAVLTVLGAAMIYLNYFRDTLLPTPVTEVLHTLAALFLFLIAAVMIALFCFVVLGVTGELRRKFLHMIAFLTTPVMALSQEHWYAVAIVALLFAAIVYPILCLLEKKRFYRELFQEREHGEIKKSLLLLFFLEAALVTVFWGILSSKETVILAILVWGFGDGTAALVGKRFGKHRVNWRIADQHKTFEGSAAMVCVDVLILLIGLPVVGVSWLTAIPAAVAIALVSALVELTSRHGYDTVSVPVAAAVMIFLTLQV